MNFCGSCHVPLSERREEFIFSSKCALYLISPSFNLESSSTLGGGWPKFALHIKSIHITPVDPVPLLLRCAFNNCYMLTSSLLICIIIIMPFNVSPLHNAKSNTRCCAFCGPTDNVGTSNTLALLQSSRKNASIISETYFKVNDLCSMT